MSVQRNAVSDLWRAWDRFAASLGEDSVSKQLEALARLRNETDRAWLVLAHETRTRR